MKNSTHYSLALAAVTVMVCFFAQTSSAQGNFDPAQFRERQMERYRERIEVKSDEDWKKLEPIIGKVMDAQRDARLGLGFGGFGGRGGGRGGGGDGGGNDNQGGNRNRGGNQTSQEVKDLQKAFDDKASAEDIKAKLAKVREARKSKEAALEKAQDELRKALSPRQEAGAVLAGLLR
jgi:hypothetical protein